MSRDTIAPSSRNVSAEHPHVRRSRPVSVGWGLRRTEAGALPGALRAPGQQLAQRFAAPADSRHWWRSQAMVRTKTSQMPATSGSMTTW